MGMLNLESITLSAEDKKRYTLSMSHEEIAELSPVERLKYERAQAENVFGVDVKFKNGRPVEVGVGSPGNTNANHLAALERERSGRDINEAILASVKQR
jgi:hypothetical protein